MPPARPRVPGCVPGRIAGRVPGRIAGRVVALVLAAGALGGCSEAGSPGLAATAPTPATSASSATSVPASRPAPSQTPSPTTTPAPTTTQTQTPEPYAASDGRPRAATLSVPTIGLTGLAVVPYRGRTDDAPGTAIQDGGAAASPHGPRGGTGPGGVGNYQVTAHRLSSTRAFEQLPDLRRGDVVHVEAGGVRYTYRVTATRQTSFRSAASLRAQRAAVPGRPGKRPTRPMITLSTCATPEDHAVGNYWSDRFGNPEHRIDKIGVLVRTAPAR